MKRPPSGLKFALTIAARGYRVFPVNWPSKVPAIKDWPTRASSDPLEIEEMWRTRPRAAVGVACGPELAVDLDEKSQKHGIDNWIAWCTDHGVALEPFAQKTLSGGAHILYLLPAGERLGLSSGSLPKGIDIRCHGGFIVAYGLLPPVSELPVAPEPLLQALIPPEKRERRSTNATVRDPALGLHPYAQRAIGYELARLDECARGGDMWDNTCFAVAANLIEFANSPWSGYSLEQAHEDWLNHAPVDGTGFPESRRDAKWESALVTVGDNDRPEPDGMSFPEWTDETPTPNEGKASGADPWMSNLVPGDEFILGAPDHVVPLWGAGSQVLWSKGEALMITGPQGVGKTTVVGQVVRALMLGGDVLGLPVKKRDHVLYLAMDRPAQIARSIRRTLRDLDPEFLRQHLTFWKGPPPADLARDTGALLRLARLAGADTVVIDSLKDAALKLSEDETGSAYNRARQTALAAGVEIIELHHMVKSGSNGKGSKPTTLPDVYGSVWLTSGVGSVILLWGEPGDPVVELTHLKQPAETIGPLSVTHDHDAGTSTVNDKRDVVAFVRQFKDGVTAKDVADFMFNGDTSANKVARARRRLTTLTKENRLAVRVAGDKSTPTVWTITPTITPPDPAETSTGPP